ncbi:MAG: Xylulose kinase [Firmicutes bacterium ADurb.Bin300]|nr:MAG: Xylulose kinase [Firmicutes bacterium ADurb.Bin300]
MGVHAEDLLNKELSQIPPGSGGLIIQPYWTPELMLKDARGAIIGFNDTHTRIHIYRAIIEGINFALMDGIERIEHKTKTPITRVMVAGGGSQSDEICQITADMLGRPVCRVQTHETSGLGAAILGFTGIGEFSSLTEAVKSMVQHKDVFTPDTKNNSVYRKLYEQVYKNMYPALKGLYKATNGIFDEAEL